MARRGDGCEGEGGPPEDAISMPGRCKGGIEGGFGAQTEIRLCLRVGVPSPQGLTGGRSGRGKEQGMFPQMEYGMSAAWLPPEKSSENSKAGRWRGPYHLVPGNGLS